MTTSLWRHVADELRSEIDRGQVGPAGELDTEAELCRRFATSRITVRRALAELKTEGLVTSQRGSGWRAKRTSATSARLVITATRQASVAPTLTRSDASWRVLRPTAALVAVLARLAPASTADLTSPWTRLSYVYRADGTPFDLVDLWLAPSTANLRIPRHEFVHHDTALLLHQHGVRFGPPAQSARADLADARDARHLGCAPTDPILVVERALSDESGAVVLVSLHRHPGRRVTLDVELPTTDNTTSSRLRVHRL